MWPHRVIAALVHDLGKVGYPGKPYYLRNDVQWEVTKRNMTYKVNPETTMNRAVRSLYLISSRIELSEDEAQAQAIVAPDGLCQVAAGGVASLDHHHEDADCR